MVQKEKQVKSYTRKSKSGKQVQVKSYSAKYNSAEDMVKEALKQKKGAGKELLETKKKQKVENIPDYDFSMDDFAHWYEGDGSKQDKAVEKSLRKILGKKNYEALNDYVADNYKKNGYKSAFKKVNSFKEGVTTKDGKSSPKSKASLEKIRESLVEKNGGTVDRGNKTSRTLRKVEKELSKFKKSPKNSFGTKKEAVEFAKSKGLTINEYGTIMDGHKVLGSPIKSNGRWLIPSSIFRRKDKAGVEKEGIASLGIPPKGSKENKGPKISDSSLKAKGYVSFKDFGTTLYIGKRGKAVYMKTSKGIVKADRDDYADFVTGHNGLSKSNRKKLESLGWHEHEEY